MSPQGVTSSKKAGHYPGYKTLSTSIYEEMAVDGSSKDKQKEKKFVTYFIILPCAR